MSSPRFVIARIVVAAVAGTVLLAVALAVVATGDPLSRLSLTALLCTAGLGFVLDTAWLCVAVRRLARFQHGSNGEQGESGERWGGPGHDPTRPLLPSDGADWWPAFERDLRACLEARERAPIAG